MGVGNLGLEDVGLEDVGLRDAGSQGFGGGLGDARTRDAKTLELGDVGRRDSRT